MKHPRLFLVLIAALFAMTSVAYGQGTPAQDGPPDVQVEGNRPNLFAELGLSQEQNIQIRRINRERRPRMMRARFALGEAQRNLDMAIYADVVNDADVQAKLKEFQMAESELARLRFESELAIRKVLTADQLVKFRDIRRRFAEQRRKNVDERRRERRGDGIPSMQERPFRKPAN